MHSDTKLTKFNLASANLQLDEDIQDPVKVEVDAGLQTIFDAVIGEETLIRLTGTQDLSSVTSLRIRLDLNLQSTMDISDHLPRLTHLTLDESVIDSVRDLGTGLSNLLSLSLNRCGLKDLDGIRVLTNLQELSVAENCIADVAGLAMHEHITILNLSANKLCSFTFADDLNACPQLKALVLSKNFVATSPYYRDIIIHLLPGLATLDKISVERKFATSVTVTSELIQEAEAALQQAIDAKAAHEHEAQTSTDSPFLNMGGSKGGMSSAHRKDPNANKASSLTHSGHHTNSFLSGKATTLPSPKVTTQSMNNTYNEQGVPDTGSELTHGSTVVLAGNMAAAMRRRNKEAAAAASGQMASDHSLASNDMNNRHGVSRPSYGGKGEPSNTPVPENLQSFDSTIQNHNNSQLETLKFLGEGDITAIMLPERAVSPSRTEVHSKQASRDKLIVTSNNMNNSSNRSIPRGNSGASSSNVAVIDNSISVQSSIDKSNWQTLSRNSFEKDILHGNSSDITGKATVVRVTMREAPEGPFKVPILNHSSIIQKTDVSARLPTSIPIVTESNNKPPIWAVLRAPTGHRAEQSNNVQMEGNGFEYHNDTAEALFTEQEKDMRSVATIIAEKQRFGQMKSYIHQDMVVRTAGDEEEMLTANNDSQKLQTVALNNAASEWDESIGTSSASRYRMMERAVSRGGSRNPSSGPNPSSSTTSRPWTAGSSTTQAAAAAAVNTANKESGVFPSKGMAALVGASLGFNLQQSLAAIDNWVGTMDESSSDDSSVGYQAMDGDGEEDGEDENVEEGGNPEDVSVHPHLLTFRGSVKERSPGNSPTHKPHGGSLITSFGLTNTPVQSKQIQHNLPIVQSPDSVITSPFAAAATIAVDSPMNGVCVPSSDSLDQQILPTHVAKNNGNYNIRSYARPQSGNSSRSGSAGSNRSSVSSYTASGHAPPPVIWSRDAIFSLCSGGEKLESFIEKKVDIVPIPAPTPSISHRPLLSYKGNEIMKPIKSSDNSLGTDTYVHTTKKHSSEGLVSKGPAIAYPAEEVVSNPITALTQSSPPRTEDDTEVLHKTAVAFGPAVQMSDIELIAMLQRPPKLVPQLRTKTGYIEFFKGMNYNRMQKLLETAYDGLSEEERLEKVDKRLKLLSEILL